MSEIALLIFALLLPLSSAFAQSHVVLPTSIKYEYLKEPLLSLSNNQVKISWAASDGKQKECFFVVPKSRWHTKDDFEIGYFSLYSHIIDLATQLRRRVIVTCDVYENGIAAAYLALKVSSQPY